MNGREVDIRRPVLLGALEAARQKGLIRYQVVRTAEGVILAEINGLAEDNRSGSWWYEVNGKRVLEDMDEVELEDGDEVLLYRSRLPRRH